MIGHAMRWTAIGITLALAAPAASQPSATRGELLYKTHCLSCHTSEVHWRDHRLAIDWNSLQSQVRRWQRNSSLNWGEQEIIDVTRYLNGRYYHFAPPARQV